MGSSSCTNVMFINVMAYNQYIAIYAEILRLPLKTLLLFSNKLEIVLMNLLIFPSNDFTVCIH